LPDASLCPGESLDFDFLPSDKVVRRRIVLREPTSELGFYLLTELWLVTVFHEPIPELVNESDAIPNRPGVDFSEDHMEIH
jgi:hypothetical protein